jgi:hypothetical protein
MWSLTWLSEIYLAFPVMILFYIVGYIWKRTLPQRAHEIDIDTGRKSWLTVEEMKQVRPHRHCSLQAVSSFVSFPSTVPNARLLLFTSVYTAYFLLTNQMVSVVHHSYEDDITVLLHRTSSCSMLFLVLYSSIISSVHGDGFVKNSTDLVGRYAIRYRLTAHDSPDKSKALYRFRPQSLSVFRCRSKSRVIRRRSMVHIGRIFRFTNSMCTK